MILALDVGNSHIFGGLFVEDELQVRFRRNSKGEMTSDELGVFLRAVIREWGFDPVEVRDVAVCSVVPTVATPYSIALSSIFKRNPSFSRQASKRAENPLS